MDETVETVMIGVRADTQAFARDAATMQASLQMALGTGADRAATLIESGLARAVQAGKLSFADLEQAVISALSQMAGEAVKSGLASLIGMSGVGEPGGGTGLLGALFGSPGRATGGPVSPGRPYMVGERGPELFVPTSAGSIAPAATSAPARDVRVAISIAAPAGAEPRALAQSGRQVARAVSRALAQADR
jgi:hypothetical protein